MGRGSVRETRVTGTFSLPETHWRQLQNARRLQRAQDSIDHVVVGPSGVNVIAYWPSGFVDDAAARRTVADTADVVRDLLPDRYRSRVNPIGCHLSDEPVAEVVDGVMVTSLLAVEQIVRSSPLLLSTSEVSEVFGLLQARLEPVPAVPAGSRSRWRRRLAGLTAAAAATAAGMVAFGSEIADVARLW